LQKDEEFRQKCTGLYVQGYRDWTILSAIYNCMLNWELNRTNFDPFSPPDKAQMDAICARIKNK